MAAKFSTRRRSSGEQFEGTGRESDVVSFICAQIVFLFDSCLNSGFQLNSKNLMKLNIYDFRDTL